MTIKYQSQFTINLKLWTWYCKKMQILSASNYFGCLQLHTTRSFINWFFRKNWIYDIIKNPPYCSGEVHRTKLVIFVQSCNSLRFLDPLTHPPPYQFSTCRRFKLISTTSISFLNYFSALCQVRLEQFLGQALRLGQTRGRALGSVLVYDFWTPLSILYMTIYFSANLLLFIILLFRVSLG